MCGLVPFGEDSDDPYEIYEHVVQKELTFPQYMNDPITRSLFEQMLTKQQEVRFSGSFTALKNHPWFDGFQWVHFV